MRRRLVFAIAAGLALLLGFDGGASSDAPAWVSGAGTAAAAHVASLRLTSPNPRFGGFSAVDLGADGSWFTAISDRGAYVQGRIIRNAEGLPVSVQFGPVVQLLGDDARPLAGRRSDSEGLAIDAKGRVFVSFESVARISRYDGMDGMARDLPDNPDFARLPANEGLEALALDADGTVFAVPEALLPGEIPVYVFRGARWQAPLSLPRLGRFLPVAADFGPDGRFYLLERRFHGPAGFSSRLRRFDVTAAGFSAGETLVQTRPGLHDNLEGLSIWRAAQGLRATMIADDNFFFLQVTELVEYSLPD